MWWLIPLILLSLIVLLLFLKVRLCICFEDELTVKVKVLFFNIPIFPKAQKKLNPSDYSIKKLRKKQEKLNKKSRKNKQPAPAESAEPQKKDRTAQIKEILELVKIVLENVMSPFGRYLKVEIVRIYVKIATSDAAKTAVMYGLVSQTVAYILELFSNITNVDVKKKDSINVFPDFLSENSEANINITLGLQVWHALSLAVKFFIGYLKRNTQTQK